MSGFTARPSAVVSDEVVSDHGDFGERIGTVSDDVDVFDGGGEFSVFDEESVFDVERVIAGADEYLSVHEFSAVDAVFDIFDEFFEIVRAVIHACDAHSRDWVEFVGFASSVASGRYAVVTCTDFVVQVAGENAVLNENGVLTDGAFVVDVESAARIVEASGVVDGDFGRGDFLIEFGGEYALFFSVKVGFESVSDGFV